MPIATITYEKARPRMRPGDVIAFGGKGNFSEIIKLFTSSGVSHVGVILRTKVADDTEDRYFNQIIESTSLNGFNGVNISRFSQRLANYDGELWWLPLKKEIREAPHDSERFFDSKKFFDFLFRQEREKKEYDLTQAIKSALDTLDQLPFDMHGPAYNTEDFGKFFCSELVAAGLEAAGVVGSINASEVTPIDLCRWRIYKKTYYRLKGDPSKQISRYNSLDPQLWNV